MKKFIVMALVCAATLLCGAEKNLLSGAWKVHGKKSAAQSTVIQKNGQIDCMVKAGTAKGNCGVSRYLTFKKPLTGSITFGAESKGEKVTGKTANNYCVYLDLTYVDGKRLWARTVVFNKGTSDWTKKSRTIKLEKPVKAISYHVLFRNVTGKASFRNVFLYNK